MKQSPKIIIENNAIKKMPRMLKKLGADFVIITDANLKQKGSALLKEIRAQDMKCHMIVLPPGESAKSPAFVEKIARALIKLGIKRDACIIALGGGVIGDLAGFVASIFMRGIGLVSVPTTLLSMADSCIGGKTGVDLPEGKNLLGTFHHPQLVVIDPMFLKTLREHTFVSGLSEIVKHAVIADKKLFNYLEKHANEILNRKPAVIKKILSDSVRIKMKIVAADERESVKKAARQSKKKSRMLLNYGHTVGHALELLSGYTLPHGDAVAIGMIAENRLAVGKKILSENNALRILALLKKLRLPVKIPPQYSKQTIKKAMYADKKTIGGKLFFALPVKIGRGRTFNL